MKKKIVLCLFIINSLVLFVYFVPIFQTLIHLFFSSNSTAIGIIGGSDGATAIFITSKYSWFPLIAIILEIMLGICVLIQYSRK